MGWKNPSVSNVARSVRRPLSVFTLSDESERWSEGSHVNRWAPPRASRTSTGLRNSSELREVMPREIVYHCLIYGGRDARESKIYSFYRQLIT